MARDLIKILTEANQAVSSPFYLMGGLTNMTFLCLVMLLLFVRSLLRSGKCKGKGDTERGVAVAEAAVVEDGKSNRSLWETRIHFAVL